MLVILRVGKVCHPVVEMNVAREAADRVVFMDGGRIVEEGSPAEVLGNPRHPRTRLFLSRFIRES